MRVTQNQIIRFQNKIFSWWDLHKRDLPWRHTRDPYKILVSEVMLQQTQVSRVLPKYEEFMYLFPDVYALANASPARVLTAWKGMGYNRRALYLKRAAERVVGMHQGQFPSTESELLQLPGLGKYTARAIMVFAFGKDVSMVDTNIRQIITHFFFKDLPQSEKDIWDLADKLVPVGKSWEWHQALMDFGALQMKKEQLKMSAKGGSASGGKNKIPFRETNRFYRGRVMDRLREGPVREFVLLKDFMETYDKPEDFLVTIINKLEKDGLLVRKKEMLQLPQ